MALNWDKFKSAIHYVCHKADDPSVLGAIKLNKVLWYSDVISYMISGKSITGETYIKRQFGPVPKHVLTAIDQLVAEKKIARGKVDHFGFMKNEYISILEPDLSVLSGADVERLNESFEHVCLHHTAMSVSEETHGEIWKLAQMGEEIPYETVFVPQLAEIDESDVKWAQQGNA